ncbi:transmembrane protein adipocyte-associated 1 homolog isoform X3 [Dermacentor albipictus]|uniref:transmembrane protein adipocyte-associated 1 homolog isoform X3 n=1 Tax=Dermacentor albipictus TaxID=60249 RepID=UPI0038FC4669
MSRFCCKAGADHTHCPCAVVDVAVGVHAQTASWLGVSESGNGLSAVRQHNVTKMTNDLLGSGMPSTSNLFNITSSSPTPAVVEPEYFCKWVLYHEIPGSRVRMWDLCILVPNVVFLLFMALRFNRARLKLRATSSPIFSTFYILVSLNAVMSVIRCVVSMTVNAAAPAGGIADKALWVVVRFFLLSTEMSVLIFGLAFGHLDSRTSIQRVLLVTSFVALLYSGTQGVLELVLPDRKFYVPDKNFELFGHGGMLFWFISSVLFAVVLPWIFTATTTNNGLLAFFRVPRGNDTADCTIFDQRSASVTSSLDIILKEPRCDIRFRGHGTWLTNKMLKPPLLLLQVLPWIFTATTTNNGLLAFFRVPRGNDTADCTIFDQRSASVTSSLDIVLKEPRCDIRFRGHGTWLTNKMLKPPLLLLQVYIVVFLLPWTGLRERVALPAKQSFYWYALFLAVLNLTQAAGSGLYYYDIREGVCVVDVTSYLYFTIFTPLVYKTFLADFFSISQPSIMFSYKAQTDDPMEDDNVSLPHQLSCSSLKTDSDYIYQNNSLYDSTHFDAANVNPLYAQSLQSPDSVVDYCGASQRPTYQTNIAPSQQPPPR